MHKPAHRLLGTVAAVAAGFAFISSGCRTETFEDVDELDQIATARESGRNFDSLQTFALSETVIDLSSLVQDPAQRDKTIDPFLLTSIESNMVEAGYRQLPASQAAEADVALVAGAVVSNNWVWYGYYPCWDPYYCYWYPPAVVPVNLSVGAIVILMLRLQEQSQNPDYPRPGVPVIWAAGLRGLTASSGVAARVDAAVDQAFDQSPYLTKPKGEAP